MKNIYSTFTDILIMDFHLQLVTYFPKPISPGLFLYADHVIASLSNVEGLNTPNMDLLHKDKDGEGVKQGFAGVFVQNMEARFPLRGARPVD